MFPPTCQIQLHFLMKQSTPSTDSPEVTINISRAVDDNYLITLLSRHCWKA
jgi:hypothetical protein